MSAAVAGGVGPGSPLPLATVAALPGVMGAALLSAGGELLDQVDIQGSFPDHGLTAALAAAGVLSDSVGGQLRQAVFAYRGGPWLLVVLPAAPDGPDGERTLALRLSGLSDLARVRFELPRLFAAAQDADPAN